MARELSSKYKNPPDDEGKQKTNKTKKQAKLEQILTAKDLTSEEYEELSLKKNMGKTTTEENLQVEKKFWHNFFLTSELKEDIPQNFIYDQNLFKNFLSLIDFENYEAEDNIRTEKQTGRVYAVDRLLAASLFRVPP